jgi:hypothetical protein
VQLLCFLIFSLICTECVESGINIFVLRVACCGSSVVCQVGITYGNQQPIPLPPFSPQLFSSSDSSSYLPHITADASSLLPPLKAKLNGGSSLFGTAAAIVAASNGHSNNSTADNCDTMSLNGSLVSNGGGVINVTNGSAAAHLTNGSAAAAAHLSTNGSAAANGGSVHMNGLATLPLVRPNTGESSSRTSTLDSPVHEGSMQNGKSSPDPFSD